jgi:acyl-[acyl-carrier-protein]-phospholipid O-acyltransferase/long-chain-fatty-acid--[acyl-carrier-protein] ligase
MATSLMLSRRFAPLFWCQFFAAFSDNVLKNALVFLILFKLGGPHAEVLITLVGAIFIAPFFVMSGLGGEMADRFDKARVAQWLKFVEIALAGVAVIGFAIHSLIVLFLSVLAFGVIAALFGPIKYGILPDHLARSELPAGNALIEGATFLAILLGTIVGGLAARGGGDPGQFAALMLVFSLACWGTSLLIPPTGEAAPTLRVSPNVLASTAALLRHLRGDYRLWWGALVVSVFWLDGALVLALLPPLVKTVLGGVEEVVTVFLALFSIAIAVGSGLAAWLARGRLILWPTLLGAVLIGAFALDLGFVTHGLKAAANAGMAEVLASPSGWRISVDLAGLAAAGGLYVVPVFAAVQAWAGSDRRARVIAAVNVLNAGFMTGGAIVLALAQTAGLSTPMLFAIIGLGNLATAAVIARTMPKAPANDDTTVARANAADGGQTLPS